MVCFFLLFVLLVLFAHSVGIVGIPHEQEGE